LQELLFICSPAASKSLQSSPKRPLSSHRLLFFFSKGKMHFSTTLLGLSALLTSTVLATPTGSTLLPQEDVETGYSVIAPSEIPKYITEGAAAYATKLNETAAAISKRQNVGVFFCVDKDFTGYCVHIVQPANTCSE
jgi:hypothetical protein